MRRILLVCGLVFATYTAAMLPAKAQTADTPQQLQAMIADGQAPKALGELHKILQAHPTSGVAWYLAAEAQDAYGDESAARIALANAQQYAPGLPFANQADVAALQAHLNGAPAPAVRQRSGISPGLAIIVVLVIGFVALRLFRRRRMMVPPGYQSGFGAGGPGGPGPYPYNQGPGMGGGMGIGGSLLGGLVAGAGFAAGERVIGDMFGGNNGNNNAVDPAWGNQPMPDAARDDGLQGSPGWDSGSAPDDNSFDPGNNW